MRFKAMIALALVVLLPVLAPVQAKPARQDLVSLGDSDLRVATIGLRLLTANAGRCTRQMPATGLLLHSLAQYGNAGRNGALAQWSFPSAVSIEAVVAGGPAARADLRSGDGIEAIAGIPLARQAPTGSPATFLRDAAEQMINALPHSSAIRFSVIRDGKAFDVELVPVAACRNRIEVVAGSAIKARSDGSIIQIGQAFAARLDDDGVAVALAHELAHSILDHRAQLAPLEAATRDSDARRQRKVLARQFEDEADILSLGLLATAGWDPAIAPRFMRQEGREFDPLFSGAGLHRSAEDRARRMERAIVAMKAAICPPRALTLNWSTSCLQPRPRAG